MNVRRYCKKIWRRVRLVVRFVFVLLKLLFCHIANVCKTLLCRWGKQISQLPKPSTIKPSFISRKSSQRDQKKSQELTEQALDPISALVPVSPETDSADAGRQASGKLRELLASKVRFTRHLRMLWVRRAMLACAILCALCLLSASLLGLIRVKHIEIVGLSHYTEQEILSVADISEGDQWLALSPKKIEQRLLKACPYLASATVRREGQGTRIVLREREALWALALSEERLALLDEALYVLEFCSFDEMPQAVCTLKMDVRLVDSSQEGQERLPQLLSEGSQLKGESSAVTQLLEITKALNSVSLPFAPSELDLTDRYDVNMILQDGTLIQLHECADAKRQLTMAVRALEAYHVTHGSTIEQEPLCVDIDDFFHVSVRPVRKNGQ